MDDRRAWRRHQERVRRRRARHENHRVRETADQFRHLAPHCGRKRRHLAAERVGGRPVGQPCLRPRRARGLHDRRNGRGDPESLRRRRKRHPEHRLRGGDQRAGRAHAGRRGGAGLGVQSGQPDHARGVRRGQPGDLRDRRDELRHAALL